MKSNSTQRNKSADDTKTEAEKLLHLMFTQAKAQFGNAVKSFWFYDGDLCPGCMTRPIGIIKIKGENALALNGFNYRQHGVLIGYFLCESCAKYIFKEAEKHPSHETPLHANIERNLIAGYHKHLASLDA
ncbi:MAG TPA: hypothetical protein VK249_03325 [Anaerolineales bacterium]|nr:hypothetical protein [Anaerolineales bacterium]